MKWSRLNATQRANVQCGARYNRDVVRAGQVIRRGDPKNEKGVAVQTLRALDLDARRARDAKARALNAEAIAAFTATEIEKLATRLPSGPAYGSRDLNKRRAGAMPMNYYRGSAIGC